MIDLGTDRKIVILGCGGVGKCVTWYLQKFYKFNYSQVWIIEKDANAKNFPAVEECIKKGAHFKNITLVTKNVSYIFDKMIGVKDGDVVIDLTTRTPCAKIFTECRRRQLFYFNTDIYEEYTINPSAEESSNLYDSSIYMGMVNMRDAEKKTRRYGDRTIILECGMNPGLISIFMKKGILDIAKKVLKNKKSSELSKYVKNKNYSDIAKYLKIRVIHCSEIDTQIVTNDKAKINNKNKLVNTWSCVGFIDEGSEPCEIAIGTHEKIIPLKQENIKNIIPQVVVLDKEGRKTQFISYVPESINADGTAKFIEFEGISVHHGEGLTFNEFLGRDDYAPTMHYVYKPTPSVESSIRTKGVDELMNIATNANNWKVLNVYEDGISGYDNVGALFILEENPITGDKKPWGWWSGSMLHTDYTKRVLKDPYFGPTTIQVMAGVLSHLAWALKNPNKGKIYSDAVDSNFILSMMKKYLGVVYSGEVTGVDIAGYTIEKLMVGGRDAKHTVIDHL
jgi:homospermidine synthase